MNEPILVRREGAVQVLSFNNPAARNALTAEVYKALPAALDEAQRDPETGAIVLTGVGSAFCAGGDLNRLGQRRAMTAPERRAGIESLHDMIRAIRDCGKPVIAAVEGAAAGAGLSIALACDLLVAARNASFSVAYVKVGLSPDGGATAFLSGVVSRQLMTELCLTGRPVTGERMHALGVANRLAEPGSALSEALAMAQLLAAGPERAIGRIKRLCRQAGDNSLEAQLDLEADFMAESLGDDESAEGIAAFFDKRAADFAALRRAPDAQTQ
ncbi:enoyl-CoA hydratase [Burkholderia sp. Ac-20365]|jgi:enoyl-CoA hydratase/carnithine racemase|uniref:oxepin-CoA hydrolase, alternative type n=1 Tax=Burkholderia sp. Ac-20365 TaxID=2703897 RepID=UPI00197B2DB9|nr:enoyl-CoA hydratase [Burkholderia sp. Ac-20365]MBN3763521.1 enoyl-CoA hydratase [Burkholderia sp. Ac-20365]